jgi:S1-C subfamily serine protease
MPMVPMAPLAPLAPASTMIHAFGTSGVAGAQLTAITDGLARVIGVQRGVLVTHAAPGSPAQRSGLEDGDVIVRVAGEPVHTVAQLREQVQKAVNNGESSVELDCVRERKARRVMLRWHDIR